MLQNEDASRDESVCMILVDELQLKCAEGTEDDTLALIQFSVEYVLMP